MFKLISTTITRLFIPCLLYPELALYAYTLIMVGISSNTFLIQISNFVKFRLSVGNIAKRNIITNHGGGEVC